MHHDVETPVKTPAEQALFQLQFMGIMMNVGRQKEADAAYQEAQRILMEMVEKEKGQ